MGHDSRPRRLIIAALTVGVAVLLAACAPTHPNSIFHHRTDFNRDVSHLFDILIWLGTFVFIFVEGLLVITLIRFRKRDGQPAPTNMHGNLVMEIAWTTIPALILAVIAVPSIRVIFRTEAPAKSSALQVTVTGHQWWWQFDYPDLHITTANELYLPIGKTVNFTLKTADVIHSFWVPGLGGKRDLISNQTNYLWFTPDSISDDVLNGFCAEFCGTSHANMRFKVFTVSQAEFDQWAAHEASPAVALDTAPAVPALKGKTAAPSAAATQVAVAAPAAPTFAAYDRSKIPAYAVPETPIPAGLTFDTTLVGNAVEGEKLMSTSMDALCMSCHTVKGNPRLSGVLGPDLTHIASRSSIAAGLYPNDKRHLELWVKNAREMKPGIKMYTFGKGQFDPETGKTSTYGKLTDQQIADIVAYLQTLK